MTNQPSGFPDDEEPDHDDPCDYSEEYWAKFREEIDNIKWGDGPRLISRDELLAAGALDIPPGWRKSLSAGREQLPLFGDDDEVEDDGQTE